MRILFTRHGESEANLERVISNRNLPHMLTEVGIAQAVDLASRLARENVQRIYCSPIPRAKETAEIIAAQLELPFAITPALREFDCGGMEGRGDEKAWQAHNGVVRAWDEDRNYDSRIPPDGESFNDVKARFLPFINQLQQDEEIEGDILLISHGSVLSQMLPVVLSNVDRPFTQQHPIANCRLIVTSAQDGQLVCSEWAGIGI